MHSALRPLLPLVLLMLGAATCDLGTESNVSDVAGTYTMTTVDGGALPRTLGNGVVVATGTVQLNANGTWTSVVTYSAGAATNNNAGSYTAAGSTVSFTTTTNETFSASMSGTTMTIANARLADGANHTLVFQKQ